MLWKKSLLISVISTALYGCGAEEQSYDTLSKPSNSFDKSQLKTDQVYMYMPSLAHAPRYATSMAPFVQGDEKLVLLQFEANDSHSGGGSLTVREISPDVISQAQLDQGDFGRWVERAEDNNLVLSIPVDFVDYQCRENDYGECTNKEEHVDNNETPWQERRFFEPDFANVEVAETTRTILRRFANSCYTKVGDSSLASNGDWKGYEIADDGSINFEVKQTYRVKDDWSCFFRELSRNNRTNFEDSGLTFTISQFYSLVPLDSVRSASSGKEPNSYDPIVYLRGDEDKFGFFDTEVGRPDESYVGQQYDQSFSYLNRFNPKLKQIDYHLSDSFNHNEETLFYKRITQNLIERLNPQLAKVGVPAIKLHEPSGKQSGDLRYNMINLIDEPLSNGLAGYGPSAANPLTGEIVHAHVNQYSGVLRAGTSRYWNRIVIDYNNGRIEPIVDPNIELTDSESNTTDSSVSLAKNEDNLDVHTHVVDGEQYSGDDPSTVSTADDFVEQESDEAILSAIQTELAPSEDLTVKDISTLIALEARLWAENNMYPADALRDGATFKVLPTEIGGEQFNFDSEVYWRDGAIGQVGQLKQWHELDAKTQERLSLLLSGFYYAKTLVHELGHNLGLRHNFKGSTDADNFFKPEELVEHGVNVVPGYSSIMDYNPSNLNALTVFGPYDLAALRFGYKRQVEATELSDISETEDLPESQWFDVSLYDKPLLDAAIDPYNKPSAVFNGVLNAFDAANIDAGLQITRRTFNYCTDSNVSLNDDCNKFDEGRNREEIAQYKIEQYDDRYYTTTLRGQKESFSESGLMNYTHSRIKEFSDWRESLYTFDRYRKILRFTGISPSFYLAYPLYYRGIYDNRCEESSPTSFSYNLYCATPKAVDLYRDRLLKVLFTPDHTCEITDASDKVTYRKLAEWMKEYSVRNNYPVNHVPTSCYDEYVLSTLDAGEQVTGELGVFLNSGQAPRPAPENNFANNFDYYGNWADKLAAAVALVDRVGTRRSADRSTLSLFELPDRVLSRFNSTRVLRLDIAEAFLDRLILATSQRPLNFKNAQGRYVRPTDDFKNFSWDNNVDQMPYYGSYAVRQYFGLPRFGEVPLNKAILTAMVLHSAEQQLDDQDEILARKLSVYSQQPTTDDVKEFKRNNDQTYYATPENHYAWVILEYIDEYDALVKLEKEEGDLTSISLTHIKLTDFQDEAKRRLIDDRYKYQQQSLQNLPVYNTVRTLREDLINH